MAAPNSEVLRRSKSERILKAKELTAPAHKSRPLSVQHVSNRTGQPYPENTAFEALDGLDGDDFLLGNPGAQNFTIDAGAGNDWIISDYNDAYSAYQSTTTYTPGQGTTVLAGPGHDQVRGSEGRDYINGGSGNDWLAGNRDDDVLIGGPDTAPTESDNDMLLGGGGSDYLRGGAGQDTLRGNEGDDYLYGGVDNDWLYGGSGTDTLLGGRWEQYPAPDGFPFPGQTFISKACFH